METARGERIIILGLSNDASRYAYKAAAALQAKGYTTLHGVHPDGQPVLGVPVSPSIQEVPQPIHTVTFYVNRLVSSRLQHDILAVRPHRLIFNPGSENPELAAAARALGVEVVEGCTLVMLGSRQF